MVTARRQTRRRIEALRHISLFAGCTHDELARIDRLGTPIAVRPGRALTVEGAIGRECFVTLAGVAVAERSGRAIATIDAGSIVGEIALLDHTTRNATVVAVTPMQLLVLSEQELEQLLRIAPRVETTLRRIADERRRSAPIAPAGRDPQLLSVGSQ